MIGSGIARPSGEYASEMTGAGAWPEADETVFESRAQELDGKKAALQGARGSWDARKAELFNGSHVWFGSAAGKAGASVSKHSSDMETHERNLTDASTCTRNAVADVIATKTAIRGNVQAAQANITAYRGVAAENNFDPDRDIKSYVNDEYMKNFNMVGDAAERWGLD